MFSLTLLRASMLIIPFSCFMIPNTQLCANIYTQT